MGRSMEKSQFVPLGKRSMQANRSSEDPLLGGVERSGGWVGVGSPKLKVQSRKLGKTRTLDWWGDLYFVAKRGGGGSPKSKVQGPKSTRSEVPLREGVTVPGEPEHGKISICALDKMGTIGRTSGTLGSSTLDIRPWTFDFGLLAFDFSLALPPLFMRSKAL